MFQSDTRLPFKTTAFVAVLSLPLFAALPARGHESVKGWNYPYSCCANHDCKEMSTRAISEKPEGYVVNDTGEVVSYADRRVKESPDGQFHWCAHQAGIDAGRTICLFVPPRAY